jgi:hypothetical protein
MSARDSNSGPPAAATFAYVSSAAASASDRTSLHQDGPDPGTDLDPDPGAVSCTWRVMDRALRAMICRQKASKSSSVDGRSIKEEGERGDVAAAAVFSAAATVVGTITLLLLFRGDVRDASWSVVRAAIVASTSRRMRAGFREAEGGEA